MFPKLPSNLPQRAAATRSLTPLGRLFLFVAAVGLILAPVANFGISGAIGSFLIAAAMIVVRALWLRRMRIFELLAVTGCVAAGLVFAKIAAIPPPNHVQRLNNMRSIYIAMTEYARKHGQMFPQACSANSAGSHSWRVSLLPHIGEPTLFATYDFNEAWDGPNNRTLGAFVPLMYYGHRMSRSAPSNIVLVVGPGTLWPNGCDPKRLGAKARAEDTIIALEVKSNGVPWTSPTDLTAEEILETVKAQGLAAYSPYEDGQVIALFADGHVEFLSPHIEIEELRRRLLPGEPH